MCSVVFDGDAVLKLSDKKDEHREEKTKSISVLKLHFSVLMGTIKILLMSVAHDTIPD